MSKIKTDSGLEQFAITHGSANSPVQDQLSALLLEKMRREEGERLSAEQQAEAYRQANLAQIRQAMEQKEREQTFCNHMKPNFRSALAGQKDHSGKFHLLCQFCQKEFTDADFLRFPHLKIPGDMIGGPQ